MSELEKLTDLFHKLGARDAEGWASSQMDEGINQLGRFLFLRQAWRNVISDDNQLWIDQSIKDAEQNPGKPFSGGGEALKRLLANGSDKEDISEVVRGMQAELLFQLCYLLDDPGELEEEVGDSSWGLMQIKGNGEIVASIMGLHESVLEMDPTGREMRPSPD